MAENGLDGSMSPRLIDDVLRDAGGFGGFQRRVLALGCLAFACAGAVIVLPSLLLPQLIVEWHLSSIQAALVSTLFFAGNTCGLVSFGAIGDHFGRKRTVPAAIAITITGAAGAFACDDVISFALARSVAAFGIGGVINLTFVLVAELSGPAHRMLFKAILSAFGWAVGVLSISVAEYLVRDLSWRWGIVALAPLPMTLAATLLYLPESPRYLLASGQADAALQLMHEIARANGRVLPPNMTLAKPPPRGVTSNWSFVEKALELVHPTMLRPTVLVGAAWFASTTLYFGLVLAPLDLGTDIYLSSALGAVLEIPAYLMMPVLGDTLGRPRAWALYLVIAAVPLIVVDLLRPTGWPGTALALAARFGATGASALCYVAAMEQFPTTCRSIGVGYGAASGRLGSMLAPLIVNLIRSPSAALGIFGVAGALSALLLPETNGKPMADCIVRGGTRVAEPGRAGACTRSLDASELMPAGGQVERRVAPTVPRLDFVKLREDTSGC